MHRNAKLKRSLFDRIKFVLPDNFIVSNQTSLQEEFIRCGIVVYTWTTVCLEALWVGLPVIHLDINRPLNLDPLFEINDLKRIVSHPKQLVDEINFLLTMDEGTYERSYVNAKKYLDEYFYPNSEAALNEFVQ